MRSYSFFHNLLDRFRLKLKYRFHRLPSTAPILFITGASANHFKTLLQFLCNFSGIKINNPQFNLVVWDLGLTPYQLDFLKLHFSQFEYKRFEFEKYPDWFDLNKEGGRYAWKPQIIASSIEIALNKNTTLLCWADAGNLFDRKKLGPLIYYLDKYGIYSPNSFGKVRDWIHPKMLEWFKVSSWPFVVLDLQMRNASFMGFNLKNESVRNFINEFQKNALVLECIAPEGSNKSNHRQDQSLFTLLYYLYLQQFRYPYNDRYLGFSVQNDIDI
jgi:hypothetical protein